MDSTRRALAGRRGALMVTLAMLLIVAATAPLAPSRVQEARAQSGSARIVHSADGVLLRAEPTFGAEVLTTLPEGAEVGLRINDYDTVYDPDGVTRWWPVSSDIGDGWVAGFFLDIEGWPTESSDANQAVAMGLQEALESGTGASTINAQSGPPGGSATEQHLGGAYARVAEPAGVNLRSEPGVAAESVTPLKFDSVVELRIYEADTVFADGGRWWPVRIDGQDGWIVGTYLAPYEAVSQAAPPVPSVADVPAAQVPTEGFGFSPGSYVSVATESSSGLNVRADGAPDAERIGAIPEYDVIQVMDGPFLDPLGNGWYLITDGSVSGYVDGRWLIAANQPSAPGADAAVAQPPAVPPAAPAAGIATGLFSLPVTNYTLTQGFGCSPYWWWYPWNSNLGCHVHDALDLAAPMYTPLYAADGGVVEYAGWCDCGLGYYVKIDHLNGFKTTYGHMAAQPIVQTGQAVAKGQEIGPMGSTGTSTGSHVHFMVELNGVTVDPLLYTG